MPYPRALNAGARPTPTAERRVARPSSPPRRGRLRLALAPSTLHDACWCDRSPDGVGPAPETDRLRKAIVR